MKYEIYYGEIRVSHRENEKRGQENRKIPARYTPIYYHHMQKGKRSREIF